MVNGVWCTVLALAALWWPTPRVAFRIGAMSGQLQPRAAPTRSAQVTVGAGAMAAVAAVGNVTVAVALTIIAIMGGWLWRRAAAARASETVEADLVAAMSSVVAELSVGSPPSVAYANAGREIADSRPESDVARALTTVATTIELGGTITGAQVPQSVSRCGGWTAMATAWDIGHSCGVPMRDLLESARADLVARRSFAARTHAGLAGPRATAAVLALLPILGIGLGQALGADPIRILAGGGMGGILLVVGTALGATGLWWSLRIADRVVGSR